MTLADERLKELDSPSLTSDERALLRCRLAAEFIHTGQHEAARESLSELWRGIGQRPNVELLEGKTAAEVLLQCGALSSRIGASRQVTDVQGVAKDLISESATLFESLGETAKAALAHSDLAMCYWREGAYDEARVLLEDAYSRADEDDELKATIALRFTVVEACAGRHTNALRLLTETAPLLQESSSHYLKGSFHNELAITLWRLGTTEQRDDYLDRAIIEFTAAIYHYEQARHERYGASIENNLAFLLYKLGRYEEAHARLDHARRVLARLKDAELLAQVDETRARLFIAEKKYREANRVLAGVTQTLEKGGASALLADALTAQGVAWARLGVYESSINVLRRAMDMAEAVGALVNAGLAALTLIEEHGIKRLTQAECYQVYVRADRLLKGTQDGEDLERLRTCARMVMRRLLGLRQRDKNFNLYGAVREFEAKLIEQALEEGEGSVTNAARILGIAHQSLNTILNSRHKSLLKKRTPPKRRNRSIIKKR
jgi:tetratricopeptide (TPR) repeat protein